MSSIFKNSNGKILKNSNGKVIRKNYTMSKYFQLDIENGYTDNYLRIENPFGEGNSVPSKFSVMIRTSPIYYNDGNRDGFWRMGSADNPTILSSSGRTSVTQTLYSSKTSEFDHTNTEYVAKSPVNFGYTDAGKYGTLTVTVDDDLKQSFGYGNTYSNELNYSNDIDYSAIIEFIIGRSSRGSFFYESPISNAGFYEILIYDRVITQAEHLHFWSNGAGNEPLSKVNLLARIKCNSVEECDFSTDQDGSDMRIAIPDLSGNTKHAQIMDLPDGTSEEQITFAKSTFIIDSYPEKY